MLSLLVGPKVTPYTLSPTTTSRSSPSPATPSTLARVASPFSTIIKAFKKLTFTGQSKEEEVIPARWERDDCDIEVKVRSVAYEEKEDFAMTLASALQMTTTGHVSEAEKIKMDWEMSRIEREGDQSKESSMNHQVAVSVSHDSLWQFQPSQPTSPLAAFVKTPLGPGRQHFCNVFTPEDYSSGLFPPTPCQWGGHHGHTYLDLPFDVSDTYSITSSIKVGPSERRRPVPVPVGVIQEKNIFAWMDEVNVRPGPSITKRQKSVHFCNPKRPALVN